MTTSMEAGAAAKSHASGRRTDSPGSTLPHVLLALPLGWRSLRVSTPR